MIQFRKSLVVKALGASGLASVIFFSGVYAARALTPTPSSERNLSFSGVLRQNGQPITTRTDVLFTFNSGNGDPCSSPTLSVTPDATGHFEVQVPVTACSTVFNGSATTVDISVSGNVVSKGVPLAAVPYAIHADQLGTSDCPTGYNRQTSTIAPILCQKGVDQVVRVGVGATAFWIDRFEASVWDDSAGQHTQYGAGVGYPTSFPATAQVAPESSLYAVSEAGVVPSTQLTWFQMNRACRASGKRLPLNDEWFEAANSTPSGSGTDCATNVTLLRATGNAKTCVSVWGAEDMVGNVGEITAEWAVSGNGTTDEPGAWPDGSFRGALWNVDTVTPTYRREPLSVAHGGLLQDGDYAGVFAVSLFGGVSEPAHGFRCVIPR